MLAPVNERHDCADFCAAAADLGLSPHARHALATASWAEVRAAILNFRYWLDEPGNDVMWFWSENHVLCFHVAQYLAGDAFPGEVFPNSGRTGAEHRQAARDAPAPLVRLDRGARAGRMELGRLLPDRPPRAASRCMENAPDADLAGRARALIDQIFAMIALHTIGGRSRRLAGPRLREGALRRPAPPSSARSPPSPSAAPGAPVTSGRRRSSRSPAMRRRSRWPASSPSRRAARSRRATCRGSTSNAKLALWKSADAQLSTVAEHRTGERGHQQHVADIQLAAHPLARLWVNHPGELRVWGGGRPSYWAGNGIVPRVAQHENVALIVFDLDRHAHPIDFTHAFCPTEILDEAVEEAHWIFARAGSGYAALFASGGLPVTRRPLPRRGMAHASGAPPAG